MTSEITSSSPIRKKSPGPDASPSTVVIEPTRGWAALGLRDLWEYRDLLYFMIWRDLKGRYSQMALGPLWIVLGPLMSMVLYTVIFGWIAQFPSGGQPYAVFTYVALLPWTFFSDAVKNTSGSLLGSKDLISKVYFPRLVVPFSKLLSSLVDFFISFVILIGFMAVYGIKPTWGVLLIPLFLLLAAITGMGVGLWFAGIVVRYRDFNQVVTYLLRFWMYATPVVYAISIVPEQWRTLYRLNPMTGVIEGFRWAFLGTGQPPDWTLVVSALAFLPVFVSGLYHFRGVERSIVDIA